MDKSIFPLTPEQQAAIDAYDGPEISGEMLSDSRTGNRFSRWRKTMDVADFIEALSKFPRDWPVSISTPAGGEIVVEHREINGKPIVAVFGSNGGKFGENPLTNAEYRKQSRQFLADLEAGKLYTSIHGDHRTYSPNLGDQATCYGVHYDHRIIERMVDEGLISPQSVDLERVAQLDR